MALNLMPNIFAAPYLESNSPLLPNCGSLKTRFAPWGKNPPWGPLQTWPAPTSVGAVYPCNRFRLPGPITSRFKTGFLDRCAGAIESPISRLCDICLTSSDPGDRKVNWLLGFFWSLEKIPGFARFDAALRNPWSARCGSTPSLVGVRAEKR